MAPRPGRGDPRTVLAPRARRARPPPRSTRCAALQARDDLELVGRRAPATGGRPRRRGCRRIPVRALPAAPPGALRVVAPPAAPGGRAGHRPGRRDLRHGHGHAAPDRAPGGHRARPRLPARPGPLHPPGRAVLPPGRRAGPDRRRAWWPARRRPRWTSAPATGSTRPGCGWCRGAWTPAPAEPRPRSSGCGPPTASTSPTCCGPAPSSPARTCPTLLEAFRRLDRHGLDLVLVGPRGWNEDLERHVGSADGRVRQLGFVPEADKRALLAGAVGVLPAQPAGGLRPAGARGHGPGRAGGHLGRHGHRGGGRRRRACSSIPWMPRRLAEALASVLDDPARAERAGGRASRARAAEFPWSRTAELLDQAFHRGGPMSAPAAREPRLGANLLWLVPGVVGGSEEYTVRLLDSFARRRPTARLDLTLFVNRSFPRGPPRPGGRLSAPWWPRSDGPQQGRAGGGRGRPG